MNKCVVCDKENKLIEHHTNYKENKKVWVCRSCHTKIHLGQYPEYKCEDAIKIPNRPSKTLTCPHCGKDINIKITLRKT